jgi:putative two-component system response regulator
MTPASAPSPSTDHSNGHPRILIIDDSAENRYLLQRQLEHANYDVLLAEGGKDGLVLAQTKQPDLILLDVMMPDMDGHEVCERLSKIESTMKIPVMFVTALAEAGGEARGLELGAVDYIQKPFNTSLVRHGSGIRWS